MAPPIVFRMLRACCCAMALATTAASVASSCISTLAGGKPALFTDPQSITMDGKGGAIFFSANGLEINRINADGASITRVAGGMKAGKSGDGGPAALALLDMFDENANICSSPLVVTADGSLLVADCGNHRIRRITHTGLIYNFAGTGAAGFSGDGGDAKEATFRFPQGLALDAAGNVLIADSLNNRLRLINVTTMRVSTIAGTGVSGYDGNGKKATAASIAKPTCTAVDHDDGSVIFYDSSNEVIRRISKSGDISTIAGNTNTNKSCIDPCYDALAHRFGSISSIAINRTSGSPAATYVFSQINMIWGLSSLGGPLTVIAGGGVNASYSVRGSTGNKGRAQMALLYSVNGIYIEPKSGDMYTTEYNGLIRVIRADGVIDLVIAGQPPQPAANTYATADLTFSSLRGVGVNVNNNDILLADYIGQVCLRLPTQRPAMCAHALTQCTYRSPSF